MWRSIRRWRKTMPRVKATTTTTAAQSKRGVAVSTLETSQPNVLISVTRSIPSQTLRYAIFSFATSSSDMKTSFRLQPCRENTRTHAVQSGARANVKYTDRVRLHSNLARSRAKSGTRRCWSGFNRRPAARTIADRFLAAALLQQPLLQAFGRVAIHSTVQPAALFGALRPLFLGGRPVTRRILRLHHSGCRHENRQGNREHVVSFH